MNYEIFISAIYECFGIKIVISIGVFSRKFLTLIKEPI